MYKILWISGDHPRHLYILDSLIKNYDICGVILERRKKNTNKMIPDPPLGISKRDRINFSLHFKNRFDCEKKYFGSFSINDFKPPLLSVYSNDLNSSITHKFIRDLKPDLALLFGCSFINTETMKKLPFDSINLHGGLSPRYKGVATMFWPFYFLEPNNAGFTFHYINNKIDSGNLVHQCTPDLEINDKIHDVACKAVLKANSDILKIIDVLKNKKKLKLKRQTSNGKTFYSHDFKPEHLRLIYEKFDDQIVKMYLNGTIQPYKQFQFKQF